MNFKLKSFNLNRIQSLFFTFTQTYSEVAQETGDQSRYAPATYELYLFFKHLLHTLF